MLLSEWVKKSGVVPVRQHLDADVAGVCADSRELRAGDAFVCMPSNHTQTHGLIPAAKERGASVVIVHSDEGAALAESAQIPFLQLPHDVASQASVFDPSAKFEFHQALGLLCRAFFDDPSSKMRVIAVTGTNGKTTTSWMLLQALKSLGRKAGYLGTLGLQGTVELRSLLNTTPFPVELWSHLNELCSQGITDVVIETSSHALIQRRLHGVQFDAGVFTNLSQDHLDYHQTMEAYGLAKKTLFTQYAGESLKLFAGVLNIDDPVSREWIQEFAAIAATKAVASLTPSLGSVISGRIGNMPASVFAYGEREGAIQLRAISTSIASARLAASYHDQSTEFTLKMGGSFNVENARAALATLVALGFDFEKSCAALATVEPAPGRFDAFEAGGITIVVDYAHTPDALEKLLKSVRTSGASRMISVFGCGGDRDRTKRPKMAKVSVELADWTVLTSDNPRTEATSQIFADLEEGVKGFDNWVRIEPREEAIRTTVLKAMPGDVVVISGKGHEQYQMIGREKLPFDDKKVAREAAAERG